MFVYVVFEEKDYNCNEVEKIFLQEKDAQKYVEENYWEDEEGYEGIYYEKHEVK